MAGLLERVAPFVPFATSAETRAEAMTAAILAGVRRPTEAALPIYRASVRGAFEEAAAGCGFTLDEPVRISWWRRLAARLVYGYRRLTGQAVFAAVRRDGDGH